MALDTKRLADLNEEDIRDLIANSVYEGRAIEYKLLLKIDSDGDKKEFLYDVSSFANASGGHLLIGVADSEGRPSEIAPLIIKNLDKLQTEQKRVAALMKKLERIQSRTEKLEGLYTNLIKN